jgi:hypothetical protein
MTATLEARTVIDLSVMPDPPAYPTGEDLRPLITGDPLVDLRTAFRLHDEAKARQAAYDYAVRAAELQRAGAPFGEVFSALAAAEVTAPMPDRDWHADRLDAYTGALGIRGWYRYTDFRGQHRVARNLLRLASEGDRGRYFSLRDFLPIPPHTHSVVDRDTGKTVYRAISSTIAEQWITEKEA